MRTLAKIILGVTGIALSLIGIFFLTLPTPSSGNLVSRSMADSAPGLPIRLVIPKIKVDAAFDYVGLTTDGAVGVPKGPTNAAWFDLGPRPGQIGTAVIDGHFGWKDNIPAVFDNLDKLQKGDVIYVKDATGTTLTFVVSMLKTYGENQDASAVFGAGDGKAHLNLITCEGIWNKVQKSYSDRLVVFANKQ